MERNQALEKEVKELKKQVIIRNLQEEPKNYEEDSMSRNANYGAKPLKVVLFHRLVYSRPAGDIFKKNLQKISTMITGEKVYMPP